MCVREKCARKYTEDLKGDIGVDERIKLLRVLQKYSTGSRLNTRGFGNVAVADSCKGLTDSGTS